MVTIKEIAKTVGVSPATVSRVLNYDQTLSISQSKRQAIIETAEALNYATPRARRNAQGILPQIPMPLRAEIHGLIGISHFLSPGEELLDPYYVGVRLGIEARCRAYKLEIVRVFSPDVSMDAGASSGLSAMIVIGPHSKEQMDVMATLCPHLIMADHNPPMPRHDRVRVDLYEASWIVLDELERLGYRRLAFIGGTETQIEGTNRHVEQRCRAYCDWHRERDRFDPSVLALGQSDRLCQNLRLETGYQLTRSLLALPNPPDAIIAANDNMAIGAYRALQENGLTIPDDIAVVGFNDIPVAQFLHPPLSTMRIPGELVGEVAVDLVVERLNGRDYAKSVTLPTEMIWRDSTRSLPDHSPD